MHKYYYASWDSTSLHLASRSAIKWVYTLIAWKTSNYIQGDCSQFNCILGVKQKPSVLRGVLISDFPTGVYTYLMEKPNGCQDSSWRISMFDSPAGFWVWNIRLMHVYVTIGVAIKGVAFTEMKCSLTLGTCMTVSTNYCTNYNVSKPITLLSQLQLPSQVQSKINSLYAHDVSQCDLTFNTSTNRSQHEVQM